MCPPSWTQPPTSLSPLPSRLSQSTGFGCPLSCIKLELMLVTCFTYDNVYVWCYSLQSSHPLLCDISLRLLGASSQQKALRHSHRTHHVSGWPRQKQNCLGFRSQKWACLLTRCLPAFRGRRIWFHLSTREWQNFRRERNWWGGAHLWKIWFITDNYGTNRAI